jgi:hypothetical protein
VLEHVGFFDAVVGVDAGRRKQRFARRGLLRRLGLERRIERIGRRWRRHVG